MLCKIWGILKNCLHSRSGGKYYFPAYCINIRQEASVKLIFQHSIKIKIGLFGSTFQELFKFKNGKLFGTPCRKHGYNRQNF